MPSQSVTLPCSPPGCTRRTLAARPAPSKQDGAPGTTLPLEAPPPPPQRSFRQPPVLPRAVPSVLERHSPPSPRGFQLSTSTPLPLPRGGTSVQAGFCGSPYCLGAAADNVSAPSPDQRASRRCTGSRSSSRQLRPPMLVSKRGAANLDAESLRVALLRQGAAAAGPAAPAAAGLPPSCSDGTASGMPANVSVMHDPQAPAPAVRRPLPGAASARPRQGSTARDAHHPGALRLQQGLCAIIVSCTCMAAWRSVPAACRRAVRPGRRLSSPLIVSATGRWCCREMDVCGLLRLALQHNSRGGTACCLLRQGRPI